jgi:curved DNA-binding protein CbpA
MSKKKCPKIDYYMFFNITPNFTHNQLKKAYRAKALQYHPDVNSGGDEMFKLTKQMYDVLSSSSLRSKYDNVYESVRGVSLKQFKTAQIERERQARKAAERKATNEVFRKREAAIRRRKILEESFRQGQEILILSLRKAEAERKTREAAAIRKVWKDAAIKKENSKIFRKIYNRLFRKDGEIKVEKYRSIEARK